MEHGAAPDPPNRLAGRRAGALGILHHGMEAGMGRIALIIPTVGRPEDLEACLLSIARETDTRIAQIIVIDDAATPAVTLPKKLAGVPVHCLRNPQRRGAAYSRNLALTVLTDDVD